CGQIVAMLLVGSCRDVRRHPWLALRAIVVGGVSLVTYFYALRASLQGFTYLNSGFFVGSLRIQWSPRWDSDRLAIELFFVAILCLSLFGGALSGWIVGRLHRAQGITMVIGFAAFVALLVAIGTIRGAVLTSAWTAFAIIRTALNGAMLTVLPTTIVAGG